MSKTRPLELKIWSRIFKTLTQIPLLRAQFGSRLFAYLCERVCIQSIWNSKITALQHVRGGETRQSRGQNVLSGAFPMSSPFPLLKCELHSFLSNPYLSSPIHSKQFLHPVFWMPQMCTERPFGNHEPLLETISKEDKALLHRAQSKWERQ